MVLFSAEKTCLHFYFFAVLYSQAGGYNIFNPCKECFLGQREFILKYFLNDICGDDCLDTVFKHGYLLCLYSLMMLKGRSGKSFQLDLPPTLMTLSRCWRRRQISSPLAPCFTRTQSTMKRQESSHTRSTRYHIRLFNDLPFATSVLTRVALKDLLC